MPQALDLTKVKKNLYDLKRGLDGITGSLELLKAERSGHEPVPDGVFENGWHPKKERTSDGEIFEMRIADVDGTRWPLINVATHLRFTQRGVVKTFKFRKGDLPLKATSVYKLELITESKA